MTSRVRLLIHTPAFVQTSQHTAMVAVQAKLAHRLRRYFAPRIDVISILIVDACAPDQMSALEQIAGEFNAVKWSIPPEHGTVLGIRRGTNYAVTSVAEEIKATHVLRVIQDVHVFDPQALAQMIEEAVAVPGDWIASKIDDWSTTWHWNYCAEMGLECVRDIQYSNGELMLAPVHTWRGWYVSLPASIVHHWDDVMLSESFRQRNGGVRLNWKVCWSHRHGLDELTNQRVVAAHRAGLTWPWERAISATNDDGIPRLGICAIAKDEEAYIGEWLEFHRLIGVERFWIYADDEDGSAMRREIARRDRGDIVLMPWPRTGNPQLTAYDHFLRNFPNAARWIAVIDIDEFLFSPTGMDVPSILERYEDVPYHGGVFVNWLFFGDNGHVIQPRGLTIESYTRRGITGTPNAQGKLIVRMGLCPRFPSNPHAAVFANDGLTINEHSSWVPGAASSPPSIDLLRLNHYFHRSQEEAEKKWQRPVAPGFCTRNPADMARHNLNDVADTTILRYLPALQNAMRNPPQGC